LRFAQDHGYRGVEFDAKLTRDGVAILMHDDALDRTTNGRGPVAQSDWRVLQELDAGSWRDPRFAGEPIPTLEAALQLCAALGLWPNVEIKPCPERERETGAIVAREVQRCWRGEVLPLLSSFSPAALQSARAETPRLPLGLLVERVPDDWRDQVRRLGCFSLHCDHRAASNSVLEAAAAIGCPVLCYTVNRPELVHDLLSRGASAIVTDRLDLIPPDDAAGHPS
jgi:glycerophosphoryl diester phosphodiesterase